MTDKTLVASFRQGSGAMAMNAIDYYTCCDGRILKHNWAMGGEDWSMSLRVPDEIPGYVRLPTPITAQP